ncbi:MAG: hypothetical protein ACO1O1_07600 [Adhaeribacter sp.]
MKIDLYLLLGRCSAFVLACLPLLGQAQTEQDALMMGERRLCVAGFVGYSSWTHYWEGTYKRDNDNMGRVSTRSASLMLNYGLKPNLNLLVSLPYVKTEASAGTLMGLGGFQDLSLFVKYRPWQMQAGKKTFSVLALGGLAVPTSDYNIDFMPMCIGLGSKVLTGRLIADVQAGKFSASVSGAYLHRSKVTIDRPAYYTDHQINSSEVAMPNAGNLQLRTGYRSPRIIAEAFLDQFHTFGGFDIRKNDMPFVSNQMNSTKAGVEGKYYLERIPALGFHATLWRTLAGRNVGQASGAMAGVDYIFDLSSKTSR